MRFTVNFEKKHFYVLAGMLSILGIFTVLALATPFDSTLGFHPLQQVTTDQTGITSVDADENSIIDNTDKLGGSLPDSFCKSPGAGGANCPALGGSGSWTTSGSDISYSAGDVGVGMVPIRLLDVNGILRSMVFKSSNFIDKDNSTYYVDPSSVSVLDTLKVDVIELNGFTSTELSKLRFGGFFSKTGSTCNVPNPATGSCTCPTDYTDTTVDSPFHMCWGTGDSLPEVSLTWGPGVLQVVNCVAGPDYGPPDFDLEGQSCSSLGDTNNYDTWGESCGNAITAGYEVKSVRFYTQTCGYY